MADSSTDTARTAVVIVHGMGEQLPLETLRQFVRTAMPKFQGNREYWSRPAVITDSYEARRMLAPRRPNKGPVEYAQTEFFEYHWSYKMTGNKLTDFVPTLIRMMWRTPKTIPRGLIVLWWLLWIIVAVLVGVIVKNLVSGGAIKEWTLSGILVGILGPTILATVILKLISILGTILTDTFVDVARYLDRSPRSYAVRRDIREGMVDLLRGIHEDGRYSRVIVAAHSLGGYIAYDGLMSYWDELHGADAREKAPGPVAPYALLDEVERLARAVHEHPTDNSKLNAEQKAELAKFRAAQFALWRECRGAAQPWLVTDFITFGTPMYFADLLYTKNRKEFDQLVQYSEIAQCPPRNGDETVEGQPKGVGQKYGFVRGGRHYLAHSVPFAVMRWSNIYFPAKWGFFGDWFGGPLRPLFGKGIVDMPITGNVTRKTPGRFTKLPGGKLSGRFGPGVAHGRYFSFPDERGEDDVAGVLQKLLELKLENEILFRAPTVPSGGNGAGAAKASSLADPPAGVPGGAAPEAVVADPQVRDVDAMPAPLPENPRPPAAMPVVEG